MVTRNEDGGYEAQIGPHHLTFTKWGTTQSLSCLLDMMQLCSAGIGQGAAVAFSGSIDTQEVTPSLVSDFVNALIKGLSDEPKKTMSVVTRLCSDRVLIDGKRVNFETDFAEDLELMINVVMAAIEVQYRNFSFLSSVLDRVKSLGQESQAKAE